MYPLEATRNKPRLLSLEGFHHVDHSRHLAICVAFFGYQLAVKAEASGTSRHFPASSMMRRRKRSSSRDE